MLGTPGHGNFDVSQSIIEMFPASDGYLVTPMDLPGATIADDDVVYMGIGQGFNMYNG